MFTPLVLVFGGLGASFFRPIFFGAPSYRRELFPQPGPDARGGTSLPKRVRGRATRVSNDVELRPHFTVGIGTERDELNFTSTERGEIGMKKWDPIKFTQGDVILAFEQMLTPDASVQLGNRVIRQYNPRWMSRTSVSPRSRRRNFILATMAPNTGFVGV